MDKDVLLNNMPEPAKDKILIDEFDCDIRGQNYHSRIYRDGSCDLLRFDDHIKRWVVLCFKPQQNPDVINNIEKTIIKNFDLNK